MEIVDEEVVKKERGGSRGPDVHFSSEVAVGGPTTSPAIRWGPLDTFLMVVS